MGNEILIINPVSSYSGLVFPSTWMFPPYCSTIDLIDGIPSPVPFCAFLVVKKGSNIFSKDSSEQPSPLSSIKTI